MNYLAHFHLAGDDPELIVGALLGDYVKGPLNQQDYSSNVIAGIKLHRQIDQFSNHHSVQTTVNNILPVNSRRYNGIVYDVLCDYFLSNHWLQYDQRSLNAFTEEVYQTLQAHHSLLPSGAQTFVARMQQFDLLTNYQHRQTIERSLRSIHQRLRQPNPLASIHTVLWQNETLLEQAFHPYYQHLLEFSQQQRTLLQSTE